MAEYKALIGGLRKARSLGIAEIEVFVDSELLVKQIKGLYRVRNENLKALHGEAMDIIRGFRSFSVKHVPREENKRADRLAKNGVRPPGP